MAIVTYLQIFSEKLNEIYAVVLCYITKNIFDFKMTLQPMAAQPMKFNQLLLVYSLQIFALVFEKSVKGVFFSLRWP